MSQYWCLFGGLKVMISFFIMTLTACGFSEGEGDKIERSTNYLYSDTGTLNRSLSRKVDNKRIPTEVIGSIIIDIEYISPYIFVARQIRNSYRCAEGAIGSEILDEFEYWVIDAEKELEHGPFDYHNYIKTVRTFQVKGSARIKPEEYYRKSQEAVRPRALIGCEIVK